MMIPMNVNHQLLMILHQQLHHMVPQRSNPEVKNASANESSSRHPLQEHCAEFTVGSFYCSRNGRTASCSAISFHFLFMSCEIPMLSHNSGEISNRNKGSSSTSTNQLDTIEEKQKKKARQNVRKKTPKTG